MAKKKAAPNRYRSLRQLAQTEGIGLETLVEAVRNGKLVAYRLGERAISVEREDYLAWREACRLRPEDVERA
jgi:hypothetical protein